MLELKLRQAPSSISYWFPKATTNENIFFEKKGEPFKDGEENWVKILLYRLVGGKYMNTFERLGSSNVPISSLIESGAEQIFERPIINY